MSVLTDLQAAAVEIFDSFESLIINATYIQESSTYVAGGDNTLTTTEYALRLLRDTRQETISLSSTIPKDDISRDAKKYMLIVADLAVAAKVKDKVRIGAETQSILRVDNDPGDVVAIIYVG